ncbi:MAG: hypothetical protein K6F50_09310 [Kiritimatiellae bacterium]|nr:hypothetical protein [Kiritimatiellia bacterium]
MERRKLFAGIVCALLLSVAGAAPRASAASSFQKPPSAALKALKATVGKPFKAGWVFVDGKYIQPPYKVERWGTALRVNGVQISGEIVPWSEFVKTQDGVTVSRNEPETAAAEEETEQPEEDVEDLFGEDGDEMSLDDLFDDEPEEEDQPAKKKPARRPKAKKPAATVTYSFDGEFTPNEKTRAYIAKINAERTRIDRLLRSGAYICCGSNYAMLTGDAGSAKLLISKLPDIMKHCSDEASFMRAARDARLTYLPAALVRELYRNRFSYPLLEQRLKEDAEAKKWSTIAL